MAFVLDLFVDTSLEIEATNDFLGRGSYGEVVVAYCLDENGDRIPNSIALKRECPAPLVAANETDFNWLLYHNTINFFREIFMQIYAAGPGLLALPGWDLIVSDTECQFQLLSPRLIENAKPPPSGSVARSPTQKMIIIYGIARGMAHLRGIHIIHRDLKPDNVLLDKRGYPHVADLGFAKIVSGFMSEAWGTLVYAAPEVLNSGDTPTYSFEADVYSWAKTAFEIVEDTYPIPPTLRSKDFDPDECREFIIRGESLPFHQTPARLASLIRQAWNFLPERRPTFARIVETLEDESYWLPGTNRDEFRAYQDFIRVEENRARKRSDEAQEPCLAALLNERFVGEGTAQEILEMSDLGNSNTVVASGLLFLIGSFGETDTFEAVSRLKERVDLLWVRVLFKCFSLSRPLYQAVMFEEAGNFALAFRWYFEGANKGDREAILRFGSLLLLHGREEAGLNLLEVAGSRGSLQANYTLADYFMRWKRDEGKAVVYLKRCARHQVNSQFSEPYLILGNIYFRKKEFTTARRWLTLAYEIDGGQGQKAAIANHIRQMIPK
jgi:hypothetical protein